MRKSEYIKSQAQPVRILRDEYLPEIKKVWVKYGYDPNYLLDETDNFHNILEDYFKNKHELKAEQKYNKYAISDYCFQREDDVRTYFLLHSFIRDSLCGFYNVEEHRYFYSSEIYPYMEWYLESIDGGKKYFLYPFEKDSDAYVLYEDKYNAICDKYSAIFNNIAALFIAIDVAQYFDEKKLYGKDITEKNAKQFLKFGPNAGCIYDAEMKGYRKPKDFDEFAYDLHTRYWFRDPSKGYHIDAPYKWDSDIPTPQELLG